jgi:hypothetical protein
MVATLPMPTLLALFFAGLLFVFAVRAGSR